MICCKLSILSFISVILVFICAIIRVMERKPFFISSTFSFNVLTIGPSSCCGCLVSSMAPVLFPYIVCILPYGISYAAPYVLPPPPWSLWKLLCIEDCKGKKETNHHHQSSSHSPSPAKKPLIWLLYMALLYNHWIVIQQWNPPYHSISKGGLSPPKIDEFLVIFQLTTPTPHPPTHWPFGTVLLSNISPI